MEENQKSSYLCCQVLDRLEVFLNILNQACIGFVAIYMCWLCLSKGLRTMELHAWLVTIGFSLLMAEGITCHHSANALTSNFKRHTKSTIHWVLLTLGGGCGVAGTLVMLIAEEFTFTSIHAKLGFSAFVLCVISMMSGVCAFFSGRIRVVLRPLLNKTFHTLLGLATFVIALSAQYYGYIYFSYAFNMSFLRLLRAMTLVSLVLTCIGPLKGLYQRIASFYDQLKS